MESTLVRNGKSSKDFVLAGTAFFLVTAVNMSISASVTGVVANLDLSKKGGKDFIRTQADNPVLLACSVCNEEVALWKHDNRVLFIGKAVPRGRVAAKMKLDKNYSLIIRNVDITGEGEYVCKEDGWEVTSYYLFVEELSTMNKQELGNRQLSPRKRVL